jgi:signal transduction histidine kinase
VQSTFQHFIAAAARRRRPRGNVSLSNSETSASAFAHEFLNELSVVNAAVQIMECELARNGCIAEKAVNAALQHVKSGISRLASLTHEFQDQAGEQTLNLRPADVTSVIKELLAVEGQRYAAQGIRVATVFPPKLPPVLLDPLKFRQALLNLCRNASEAMPHGGTLTVRAYQTRSHVHVAVIDDGEGIPPGMDAFALFATTKPKGTGIGLPIVREIISRHGGTIDYTSAPGTGTIFHLTLPLFGAQPFRQSPTSTGAAWSGKNIHG